MMIKFQDSIPQIFLIFNDFDIRRNRATYILVICTIIIKFSRIFLFLFPNFLNVTKLLLQRCFPFYFLFYFCNSHDDKISGFDSSNFLNFQRFRYKEKSCNIHFGNLHDNNKIFSNFSVFISKFSQRNEVTLLQRCFPFYSLFYFPVIIKFHNSIPQIFLTTISI